MGGNSAMMTNSQLWSENGVLREKLLEIQQTYEREREQRLRLQAENLWLKKQMRQERETSGPRFAPKQVV